MTKLFKIKLLSGKNNYPNGTTETFHITDDKFLSSFDDNNVYFFPRGNNVKHMEFYSRRKAEQTKSDIIKIIENMAVNAKINGCTYVSDLVVDVV